MKISNNGFKSSLSGNTRIFPLDRGEAMGRKMKFQEMVMTELSSNVDHFLWQGLAFFRDRH